MLRCIRWFAPAMAALAGMTLCPARAEFVVPAAIVSSQGKDASFAERLAAKEVRRYLYLRTGQWLPMVESLKAKADGGLIVIGLKSRPAVAALSTGPALKATIDGLAAEQYLIKVVRHGGRPAILVAGGDPIGTLYGAYRLAEQMGVRFYLEGDVIPDHRMPPGISVVEELGKPLFDRRGIQPFHDFPEGPDWWNADGYKAILGQLPKLRMNFFGLHTYPEGGVGPEPVVWIGRPEDILPDGRVKAGYPSRHFTTLNGTWGYHPMKTGDYAYGAAALYDRDDYGVDYMKGMSPWPKTPEDQNELFGRMAAVLGDSFRLARELGIKTCIGTETPLAIPTPVRERLKAAGKNPADPAVVQEVYEGMFQRIAKVQPLDYYWFWTPEGWTWEAVKQSQIDATLADFRAAIAAAKKVKAPFTLATCGWVLGPSQQPALFDEFLPKDMPMSCISRQVGHEFVEKGFAKVHGRPKWSIPWLEDDPALAAPQLWVGRMRKDAADSLAYGCTGLMGIHWRTRILGPNVSALAAAAWDQKGWNPALDKSAKPAPKTPEGPLGGQIARFDGASMADTQDPVLYQTVRFNTGGYYLDAPNGTYAVTLKFVEPAYDRKGVRVFGVQLQGKTVIDRLDVFEKVGKNRALDYTFKDVRVTDGRLKIDFVHEVEFPCIAAIAAEGPVTRKINCGGPAYKDYAADWPPSTSAGRQRFLACDDFYADWARAQFGPEVAKEAAAIFAKIDGRLPRPSDWVGGPGGIKPDPRPWEQVQKEYAFVGELAKLSSQANGEGNRERFEYWNDSLAYMEAMARVNCTWARFNDAMKKVRAEKDPEAKKKLARELALPIRKELVAQVGLMHHYLLSTVTTYGELGTVTNWQQHNLPDLLVKPGQELAQILGEPLPADAMPSKAHAGMPRLIVPVVRTALAAGERLELTVIVAGGTPSDLTIRWSPLGAGKFHEVPLVHVARNVYRVTLPQEATKADLEYYVTAKVDGGAWCPMHPHVRGASSDTCPICGMTLSRLPKAAAVWPATAPAMNQTVVVVQQ